MRCWGKSHEDEIYTPETPNAIPRLSFHLFQPTLPSSQSGKNIMNKVFLANRSRIRLQIINLYRMDDRSPIPPCLRQQRRLLVFLFLFFSLLLWYNYLISASGLLVVDLPDLIAKMLWLPLILPILGVSAVPAPFSLPAANSTARNPKACAQISRMVQPFAGSNSAFTGSFPASLAFNCLNSVPNKREPAVQLVDSLKAFIQWQSTLAFLKNPPKSYMLPPVDIEGDLDKISTTAAAGGFASEYDFQANIFQTISKAHDGHFAYVPDVFKAFTFSNSLGADIVSVSSNGTSLPKLYHSSTLGSDDEEPVAITKINGQDAVSWLVAYNSALSFFQDADAQYNALFPIYSKPISFDSPFFSSFVYLGPNLTLNYEDGTQETRQWVARVNPGADFSNILSGDDFYDRFCDPNAVDSTPATPSTGRAKPKPVLRRRASDMNGYPTPIVKDSAEGTTMGFFMNEAGLEDVAVLAISAFEETDTLTYFKNFRNTVSSFLNRSQAGKKQRLIIDLTSNGGGLVFAGFELFSQLFPTIDPFNADNIRLSESLVNISRILAAQPIEDQKKFVNQSIIASSISPLSISLPLGFKFNSTDEILDPVTLQGDQFTAYIRETDSTIPGLKETLYANNITGPANKTNPSPKSAVFEPENIVLLTDGTCGSTCTIFAYLMMFQANVTTVSVGGRPQNGPMQSIGGVEGSEVMQFSLMSSAATDAIGLVTDQAEADKLRKGELGVLAEGYVVKRAADPTTGSVNLRNAFAPSDAKTPLQFLYEPANCRFFYTAEMLTNAELAWKYAADAKWTNPDRYCVQGSQVEPNMNMTLDPAFQVKDAGNGTDSSSGGSDGSNGGDGGSDNGNGGDGGSDNSNGGDGGSDNGNGSNSGDGSKGDDGNGNGQPKGSDDNNDDKKDDDKDDDKNSAGGLRTDSMPATWFLAAVLAAMLCL
ncbi:hypothetical protein GGR52DRAFT_523579 [Hypoxylon sp. FL1284]|nr:hypothetical protein GGR52DRAFT_523579 [Hypoxylon sp. FL1284]